MKFLLWLEKPNSRTWQRWRNREKLNKDLVDIVNKALQNPNPFQKFKIKVKTYKKTQNCSDFLVKKCTKKIFQKGLNAQDHNNDLKVQKVKGPILKGAFSICKVANDLINLKNNKNISLKELKTSIK